MSELKDDTPKPEVNKTSASMLTPERRIDNPISVNRAIEEVSPKGEDISPRDRLERLAKDSLHEQATDKETSPKECINVGIHTVSIGGSGDLASGAKVVDALLSSPNAEHFKPTVYTDQNFVENMEMFANQLRGTTIVGYTRDNYDFLGGYQHPPIVNGEPLHPNEDAMIFIHTNANPELLGPNTVAIEVGEYTTATRKTDMKANKVGINTGFGFNPDVDTIQAGLMYSRQFERQLDRVRTERAGMLNECEQVLKDKTGFDVDLSNRKFGLYYISSLASNYAYFDLLKEASSNMDEPVTIIAPVGTYSDNRDSVPFAQKMEELGFNYIADGKNIDRNSKITVINPHQVPNETFQAMTVLAEVAGVVTGDQSLTEAVQKSGSDVSTPFFAFTFEAKQADFLDFMNKIDPYISKLLASYYDYEMDDERRATLMEVEYRRGRLEPHLQSPLPKGEVAKLFYDKELIQRFNKAIAAIPDQMVRDRKDYVSNPEDLADATKTIEKVLEAVRMGELERVYQFIPY